MLIRPPSLQNEVDYISAVDDALVQLPDDASEAARAEHERKLTNAREKGDYSALLLPDAKASKFTLRPIPGSVMRKLGDQSQAGAIGPMELLGLAFRLAVTSVIGLELKTEKHATYGRVLTEDVLDQVRPDVINEVGLFAWQRAQAIAPKP